MEIPVIARMSDFDASIASLSVANPSLISRLLSIFEFARFSQSRRFWKWGALLLALIYAFSSVVRRIKILFFQSHRSVPKHLSSSSDLLLMGVDGDDDVVFNGRGEGDKDDDVCSSCSSEDESERRHDLASSSYKDFRVAGMSQAQKRKFRIRRRRSLAGDNFFSLAELVSGKGVVKLWDGLGLEVDFGESASVASGDSISILDLDKNVMIGSIMGQIPAVSASPKVVFTASAVGDGRVGVSSWDMRLRRRTPAVEADWRLERRTGTVVGVAAGGVDKVYVRDDVSGYVTVGDMRKAKSPLWNVTECDGETLFGSNVDSETEEE